MHGKSAAPTDGWYGWLAGEVGASGLEFTAPALPRPSEPVCAEWMDVLDRLEVDEHTVLIGHSRGGVAILRLLENQPSAVRVGKIVLVATNSSTGSRPVTPEIAAYGFYSIARYDNAAIKRHCDDITIIHSKDDGLVPYRAAMQNARTLKAKLITVKKSGHFGARVREMPMIVDMLNRNPHTYADAFIYGQVMLWNA